ncbi:MAG: hypothetical protein JNL58_17355 [Planctomyces sp.]|nr:hypothetical protein [Planctomyces sp.]
MLRLLQPTDDWTRYETGTLPFPKLSDYLRDEAQAHAIWLNSDGVATARCSLWWDQTPRYQDSRVGTIGHYSASSLETGRRLIEASEQVLSDHGCGYVIGPMDGNTWRKYRFVIRDTCGFPQFFLEPAHPVDWPDHFHSAGYSVLAEYYSAVCEDLSIRDPRTERLQQQFKDAGMNFRWFQRDAQEDDLRAIHQVSLAAFRSAFLFVPISFEEFQTQFRPLLERVPTDWILIAEQNSRVVGFVFGVPDAMEAARGHKSDTVILKSIGLYPERDLAGLGILMVQHFHDVVRERGFHRVIHAMVHSENAAANNISSRYTHPFRTYGLFGRKLS